MAIASALLAVAQARKAMAHCGVMNAGESQGYAHVLCEHGAARSRLFESARRLNRAKGYVHTNILVAVRFWVPEVWDCGNYCHLAIRNRPHNHPPDTAWTATNTVSLTSGAG